MNSKITFSKLHSFYFLFYERNIPNYDGNQMNIYAAQIMSEQRSHHLDKWVETNPNEIKRFFCLIIWMGLVRLPKILYWSRNEVYNTPTYSDVKKSI